MESVETLVKAALEGDMDAYGCLVRRFQDMAVGYAYSILHDFQLAEDAAQEAFWEAFRTLPQLREPAAFGGWFRPVVFKQCDRLVRKRRIVTIPLEERTAKEPQFNPVERLEKKRERDRILEAVRSLPARQRAATTLYYMSGYSCREVGEFLGLPLPTVKKTLHLARRSLRESLVDLVGESLRERRPSRNENFSERVMALLQASRRGDGSAVRRFLKSDPSMATARDSLGNTPVVLASNAGHEEVVQMLLSHGARIDYHQAASMGATARVRELLEQDPALLDSFSTEGFTATALAAHFGHSETLEFLLDQGSDPNLVSRHPLGVTPLHAALFGQKPETASILIARGADVTPPRRGKGWPRAGWTATHYAAAYGYASLIRGLLEAGASALAEDDSGRTPIDVALDNGHHEIAAILQRRARSTSKALGE